MAQETTAMRTRTDNWVGEDEKYNEWGRGGGGGGVAEPDP